MKCRIYISSFQVFLVLIRVIHVYSFYLWELANFSKLVLCDDIVLISYVEVNL